MSIQRPAGYSDTGSEGEIVEIREGTYWTFGDKVRPEDEGVGTDADITVDTDEMEEDDAGSETGGEVQQRR